MYNPDSIARKIIDYEERIANCLSGQVQLEDQIVELRWQPVFDSEGNVISYADFEITSQVV